MRKGASCGKEAERIIVRNGRLNGLDSQSSWKKIDGSWQIYKVTTEHRHMQKRSKKKQKQKTHSRDITHTHSRLCSYVPPELSFLISKV